MSKIKILAIPSDKHGVGKYRVLDPFIFIGDNYTDDIHVDISYEVPNDDEFFRNYDIVFFHTFIHQINHVTNMNRINWLKKEGIKVIMDIDDYWSVDMRHPMYVQIRESKFNLMKVEMMRAVDYISTTTPVFGKTIVEKLGIKNVYIFPNPSK